MTSITTSRPFQLTKSTLLSQDSIVQRRRRSFVQIAILKCLFRRQLRVLTGFERWKYHNGEGNLIIHDCVEKTTLENVNWFVYVGFVSTMFLNYIYYSFWRRVVECTANKQESSINSYWFNNVILITSVSGKMCYQNINISLVYNVVEIIIFYFYL